MMNDHGRRRPCGCGRPSYRPQPPPPLPAPDLPDCHRPPLTSPVGCSGYLMQRILASGTVHRRRACYPLNLNLLPQQTRMPFTVLNVICCALPTWEEIPYCDRQGLALRVSVPLSVQVRDADGCMYSVSTQIQEELILRFHCPTNECWRGQPMVQAAVRLAGKKLLARLQVEGFLLGESDAVLYDLVPDRYHLGDVFIAVAAYLNHGRPPVPLTLCAL